MNRKATGDGPSGVTRARAQPQILEALGESPGVPRWAGIARRPTRAAGKSPENDAPLMLAIVGRETSLSTNGRLTVTTEAQRFGLHP
jgi:hypothetical protein